ncbi:MAG: helix-turn-helix transcriptional regulator [Clostridia bacterium]|nr:helix-turn-helix transcriptional regulator [Clostridia bacterium]
MKSKNICKFVQPGIPDTLKVNCFIYESEETVMRTPMKLKSFRAILVRFGAGRFLFDSHSVDFSAGSLVFGFENETFCVIPREDEKCEYMYIDFSGGRAEALLKRFCVSKVKRCFSGFDGTIPLWHESLTRASGENIDIASESILLYTFSRMQGETSEKIRLVDTIMEITEQRFNDPTLSIAALSEELSYNYKYLSHLFKEKTGMSYSEYLRNMRMKYAVSLFDHGIDSVKNVAFLSGFSDPLYFSTVFKASVGISPKEYKNKKR